jgi:hypothetical protein
MLYAMFGNSTIVVYALHKMALRKANLNLIYWEASCSDQLEAFSAAPFPQVIGWRTLPHSTKDGLVA